jgi:hypothetical protein
MVERVSISVEIFAENLAALAIAARIGKTLIAVSPLPAPIERPLSLNFVR